MDVSWQLLNKCPVEPSNEGRKIKRQKYETEKRKRLMVGCVWTATLMKTLS
jgi:hypothetical protein